MWCGITLLIWSGEVQAANYLNIKALLDLTCQTVANMIKGEPTRLRPCLIHCTICVPASQVPSRSSVYCSDGVPYHEIEIIKCVDVEAEHAQESCTIYMSSLQCLVWC